MLITYGKIDDIIIRWYRLVYVFYILGEKKINCDGDLFTGIEMAEEYIPHGFSILGPNSSLLSWEVRWFFYNNVTKKIPDYSLHSLYSWNKEK